MSYGSKQPTPVSVPKLWATVFTAVLVAQLLAGVIFFAAGQAYADWWVERQRAKWVNQAAKDAEAERRRAEAEVRRLEVELNKARDSRR